jgi:hypothetical protein
MPGQDTEWGSAYGNWDTERLDAAQQAVIDSLVEQAAQNGDQ